MDECIVYLNHGSFGATPIEVLDSQTRFRERMERELVRFFVEDYTDLIDAMRRSLGAYLRCDWSDLAPVPNATIAVNTILDNAVHTLGPGGAPLLQPGDEIIINDHEYPACQNAIRRAAKRSGATVVTCSISFPLPRDAAAAERIVIDTILSKVTSGRTKLALLSHVTSPTALVLPVEKLIPELHSRGVMTIIDGAHAPGMLHPDRTDLSRLAPCFYTANCHKWLCSPKGSAFLYVRKDLQANFRPLALSNNAEKPRPGRSQFLTEFEYVGTQDYTAFLAIPDAIRVMGAMVSGRAGEETGWPEITRRNHDLCLRGCDVICRELGIEPPAPDSMIGSISTMILPSHDEARLARLKQRPTKHHDALQDAILSKWRIQVPIWGLAGKPQRFVRISAQLYNSIEQYEYLARALKEELAIERTL
jgi:isopenicillin-N epimerase